MTPRKIDLVNEKGDNRINMLKRIHRLIKLALDLKQKTQAAEFLKKKTFF